MLEDTYERHILDKMFADERVGLYVIRGENLVLLGEVDLQKEAIQTSMQEVPLEVLLKEKAARRQLRVSHNAKTKCTRVQFLRVYSLNHLEESFHSAQAKKNTFIFNCPRERPCRLRMSRFASA